MAPAAEGAWCAESGPAPADFMFSIDDFTPGNLITEIEIISKIHRTSAGKDVKENIYKWVNLAKAVNYFEGTTLRAVKK